MTDGVTGARIEADGRYDSATSAQCVACYGETDLHMISSCGHSICEDCLKMYLEQVMADQTSYPPKCCHKEMLINGKKLEHIVGAVLDGIFSEQYMKKIGDYKEECYTYCANCGLRVHPNSSHMAYCGGCHISTCAWCKEAAEEGHECIIKRSGRKFSEYATKRGMRRCYQCGVWVERVDGCRQVMWVLS